MQWNLTISVGLVFSMLTLGAAAQVASGNVAESSNPRAEISQAQNFLPSRTVEGCVVQQGSDYLLVPRHGRPEVLTSNTAATLGQSVGHEVKVQGRETYAGENSNPDSDYALAADQIESVSPSCPASWNEKWVRRRSTKP